jgi:MFS family permease
VATTDPETRTEAPAHRRLRPGPRSLWRHPDFMKLWSAETISQLGTQVTLLGLPLIAILLLEASAFEVGLLTAVEFLPFILFGLPAGAWVDRLRRRPILIVGDLGRAISLGSIPLAYELHALHLPQLYVVAFVNGVLTVFFDVAYMSYLPSIVERDKLVEGNSKLEGSRATAQLAGPGLAGGLIQLVGAPLAIIADAASYVWSAALVFLIRRPEPPVVVPEGGRAKLRTEIREGWTYVMHHPYLRWIAASTSSSNLFSNIGFSILLVYAVRRLGLKPGEIGIIFAIGNVGGLLGAFTGSPLAKRIGIGPAIVWSAVLFGFPMLLVPAAPVSAPDVFLIVAIFFGAWGGVMYNVTQVGLRQAITPQRMQGRMNATMRFMVWGTIPIGAFVGGVLGNTIGLRPTLWIGTAGLSLAFVPVALSPVRKLKEIPPPIDGQDLAEVIEVLAEPDRVNLSQLSPLDAVVEPTTSSAGSDQVP